MVEDECSVFKNCVLLSSASLCLSLMEGNRRQRCPNVEKKQEKRSGDERAMLLSGQGFRSVCVCVTVSTETGARTTYSGYYWAVHLHVCGGVLYISECVGYYVHVYEPIIFIYAHAVYFRILLMCTACSFSACFSLPLLFIFIFPSLSLSLFLSVCLSLHLWCISKRRTPRLKSALHIHDDTPNILRMGGECHALFWSRWGNAFSGFLRPLDYATSWPSD